MIRNFKLFGAMLVFLVSLESCKGCAVGAGAGADAGCPAGQMKINGSCTGATPYTCPTGQINIDDGKTATSCKALVAVADKLALIAEIKKAIGFGTGTTADPATNWTANLNYIDTSKVTDMRYLFAEKALSSGLGYDLELFNGRIDKWNTSNVTGMAFMFSFATAFNQPIGNWDTSNVISMFNMFNGATAFNQDIGNWNVDKVTNMRSMFEGAAAFDKPIGDWKVNKVTSMLFMFQNATAFDKDLSKWTPVAIANNLYMDSMFKNTAMFTANKLATFAPWYCSKGGTGGGC